VEDVEVGVLVVDVCEEVEVVVLVFMDNATKPPTAKMITITTTTTTITFLDTPLLKFFSNLYEPLF
jgi:hypothetical protein